jgi:hypothetical protein
MKVEKSRAQPTIAGLARYVRFGPPLLWERIEGTR